MDDCCSCKCGEERADVTYGRTRLILLFLTINFAAAALGVNQLAYKTSNGTTTTARRLDIEVTASFSFQNQTFQASSTYNYLEHDACQNIAKDSGFLTVSISETDCKKIISASSGWVVLGALAIVLYSFVFALVLSVECRKLCSRNMRIICLALGSLGLLFYWIAWIAVVGSPIGKDFDHQFGSSVGLMVIASLLSSAFVVISGMEMRNATLSGPAPAASY